MSFCLREFHRSVQYRFSNLKIMLCISFLYHCTGWHLSKHQGQIQLLILRVFLGFDRTIPQLNFRRHSRSSLLQLMFIERNKVPL